jgi:hypothetical protein
MREMRLLRHYDIEFGREREGAPRPNDIEFAATGCQVPVASHDTMSSPPTKRIGGIVALLPRRNQHEAGRKLASTSG